MPDADWVRYKQIRGDDLPQLGRWLGSSYQLERVLKRDFYAIVGLYRKQPDSAASDAPDLLLLKVYHTDPLGPIPLGWLGRWLCQREARFLEQLGDLPGIPPLLGRWGPSGYLRAYLPGHNLREFRKSARPDPAFFPELRRILDRVHQRGVAHCDLSKPENVLVLHDGRPALIDFQIAFAPRCLNWPLVGPLAAALLRYLQQVDRYHLTKLHRRSRPDDFSPNALAAARRKGILLHLHGHLLRRPYRAVRHAVLKRFLTDDPLP